MAPVVGPPLFTFAGRFDGSGPALRWLRRLDYDFKCAGTPKPDPADFLEAIDMLCEGEAESWIDSTPRIRAIMNNTKEAKEEAFTGPILTSTT
jgi:hypothetical protein